MCYTLKIRTTIIIIIIIIFIIIIIIHKQTAKLKFQMHLFFKHVSAQSLKYWKSASEF